MSLADCNEWLNVPDSKSGVCASGPRLRLSLRSLQILPTIKKIKEWLKIRSAFQSQLLLLPSSSDLINVEEDDEEKGSMSAEYSLLKASRPVALVPDLSVLIFSEMPCCLLIALNRIQKIDGVTILVNCAIEPFKFSFDPDALLIPTPASGGCPLSFSQLRFKFRTKA